MTMVFVSQAELRNGGSLDAAQRKFLRETYSSAGREEVIPSFLGIFWHMEDMLNLWVN